MWKRKGRKNERNVLKNATENDDSREKPCLIDIMEMLLELCNFLAGSLMSQRPNFGSRSTQEAMKPTLNFTREYF